MAGQLTIDTLKASSGVLATQNGMTGIAKAWVSYNGTAGTIRASFNVGSVTKNGTGNYTINFTTAMPSSEYSSVAACGETSATTGYSARSIIFGAQTTTTLVMFCLSPVTDFDKFGVAVFA